MRKLTKIIATIGPSSDQPEIISRLIDLGINVFRFNLKHNDLSWHKEKIKLVKSIALEKQAAIGVLIDLQGPEIRTVLASPIQIKIGDEITAGEKNFNITAHDIFRYVNFGQKVIVDDGRLIFEVIKANSNRLVLKAESEGTLLNRKTFNLPGASYPMPALTEKDKEAILMCHEVQVDFIALSFVRSAQDIIELKKLLEENNIRTHVISKIETKKAIENIDEIMEQSEEIMVARGDLGVELPMEQVPFYQKLIIKKCLERGIPVITATQMLHSMVNEPYPTRAEISDIANAVYDLTDSVMMSEESAIGKYPIQAVKAMRDTVIFTETKDFIHDTRTIHNYHTLKPQEMLCDTAYNLYLKFEKQKERIGGFIVFSQTGKTGKTLSRYRPKVPIFVFAPNERVRDTLTLSFGIEAFVQPMELKEKLVVRLEDMKEAFSYLLKNKHIDPDRRYILLYGDNWGVEGGVSTIKIVYPKNLG
jgi:pyruvate kinase